MERGVTMRIQISEKPMKAVLFYISKEEGADKEFMNSLNPQFNAWKARGYFPAVFESGNGSLEDAMYLLMKHNIELKAEKRLKKRERER